MKSSLYKNLLFIVMLGILLSGVFVFFIASTAQAAVIPCGQAINNNSDSCDPACPLLVTDRGGTTTCQVRPAPGAIESGVAKAVECTLDFFSCALKSFLAAVINAIIWILGLFYNLAAAFTGVVLTLNYSVTQNPIVRYGWSIVRDFANLGFVLILLIIAFATILRIEGYGMKQLLWKLVVAAVLVNFSLFFASVFIDFTNFLSQQFFDGVNDLPAQLSGAIRIDQVLNPSEKWKDNITGAGDALMTVSINGVVAIIYMLMGIVIVAAIGFMLLVRYVHLIFLLIIAPLAWLFWTFPDLSGQSRAWWNSFLKWCFFAPAALFFLFLSIQMQTWLIAQNQLNGIISASTAAQATQGLSIIAGLVQNFANMFVVGAMMVGSLIVGENFGITGARMGIGYAKKVSLGALGAVGMKGARAARRRVADPLAQNASRAASEVDKRISRGTKPTLLTLGLNRLAGAGFRGAAVGLGKIAGSGKEAQIKEAAQYKKDLASMTRPALQALALSGTPAQIAAIASAKAEKGVLRNDAASGFEATRALKHAEAVGMEDSILVRFPGLADQVKKYQPTADDAAGTTAQDKFVSQSLRARHIDEMSDQALGDVVGNDKMLAALIKSTGHLQALGERLPENMKTIVKTFVSAQAAAGNADAAKAQVFFRSNEHWGGTSAFAQRQQPATGAGTAPSGSPGMVGGTPLPLSNSPGASGPSQYVPPPNQNPDDYDQS